MVLSQRAWGSSQNIRGSLTSRPKRRWERNPSGSIAVIVGQCNIRLVKNVTISIDIGEALYFSISSRFPQLTLRGVSAGGANGAEGAGSPALLGSQPITVGWVQRRTKLRTQCNHRLDTSTGARRRGAGFSTLPEVRGEEPRPGSGVGTPGRYQGGSPDRGLGWEPQAGIRAAALTGVWGGNPRRVSGRQP